MDDNGNPYGSKFTFYKNSQNETTNKTVDKSTSTTEASIATVKILDNYYKIKFIKIFQSYIWSISLVTSCIFPLMFFTVYPAAVINAQIEPILPWISDAGSVGPQAAFFSQFIDTLCVLMSLISYTRYRQLKGYIHQEHKGTTEEHLRFLDGVNFLALCTFAVGAFFLSVPGNFRSSEWLQVHSAGAITGFTFAYVYTTLQLYLSNEMAKLGVESRPISMAVFNVIGVVSLVIFLACCSISILVSGNLFYQNERRMFWSVTDPGYWWHTVGNVNEWIAINTFSALLLCNANRMKKGVLAKDLEESTRKAKIYNQVELASYGCPV